MELGFIVLVLVVPFIIIWPVLVWAGAVKSLYTLIRDRIKQRAIAQ